MAMDYVALRCAACLDRQTMRKPQCHQGFRVSDPSMPSVPMSPTSSPIANHRSSSWMSRFTIGQRLVLLTVVPLVMFTAFAGWLWWSLGGVREDV